MTRYYYDFHIHSCLSPCADNDMTPHNIAGTATLAGLNIVALTDHNSVENCPAFYKAAKENGIIAISGMELTTAEDIHVVCLFEKLEDALSFGDFVKEHRILIKNRIDIFGEQLICDHEDNVIGIDEYLLSNATDIPIDNVPKIIEGFGGICYPAHVDRTSNGIISILGCFPKTPFFNCVGLHDENKKDELCVKFPILKHKKILISSDAHFLWDIRDAKDFIELDDEPYSSDLVRKKLFEYLRSR